MSASKSAARRILSKVATGIHGFDEISRGGLPRNRTSLVSPAPSSTVIGNLGDTGSVLAALGLHAGEVE